MLSASPGALRTTPYFLTGGCLQRRCQSRRPTNLMSSRHFAATPNKFAERPHSRFAVVTCQATTSGGGGDGSVKPRGRKVVGIDLGTTNSAAACIEGGTPTIIPNAEGGRTTPSVVAYSKKGDLIVGQVARRQAVINPENTFYSIKRFVGRTVGEVTTESTEVSYEVVKDPAGGSVKVRCPNLHKDFAPEEISAEVLRKLANDASTFLGTPVKDVVVTVPAYFNDSQRQATKHAGQIAGLEVLRIINEPTAAALAYGMEKAGHEGKIMVYDLGGGTFDVSILDVGEGVFEVLSTSGDTHLGGDDFDKRMVDHLVKTFSNQEGIDLSRDTQAVQRLTEAATKAKEELSSLTQAEVNLPFITATPDGAKHLNATITRAQFETMCNDLLSRCKDPVKRAMEDADVTANDLSEIILVGGSTRIPAVRNLVKELTGGREPNMSVNPDEVVALGAAVQGGVMSGEVADLVLLDVNPLSLGVETVGGVMTTLIPRNTTIPTTKAEVFSTAADSQSSVDIVVLQGERQLAKDNKRLGNFALTGIPPAPRGVPQIEVTFNIGAEGILQVSAKDKGTGKVQEIKITGASTLSEKEVSRMVQEAEQNAAEDAKQREMVDTRNTLEARIYQAEHQLKDLDPDSTKVKPEVRTKTEAAIVKAKEVLDSGDVKKMSVAMEELQTALMEVGSAIYAASSQQAPPSDNAGDGPSNKDKGPTVVDAEFVDVDKDVPA